MSEHGQQKGNKEKPKGLNLTVGQLSGILISIAAIAGITFAAGYLSGGVFKGSEPEKKQVEQPKSSEEGAPSFGGIVTPKKLDADVIINERELDKEAHPPAQFTFNKTLTKDTSATDKATSPVPVSQTPKPETVAPVKEPEEAKKATAALEAEKKPEPSKPVPAKKEEPKHEKSEKPKQPVASVKTEPTQKTENSAKPKQQAVVAKSEPAAKTDTAAKPKQPVKDEKPAQQAAVKSEPVKGFSVQVGSFPSKDEAQRLTAKLSSKNFMAYTSSFSNKGATWYRVRVGPFKTESAARRVSDKLKSDEKLNTFVTGN